MTEVHSAKVVFCLKRKLRHYPKVSDFILHDLDLFENVRIEVKDDQDPALHLLNATGETVEELDMSPMTRLECNNALLGKGFYKKQEHDDEVPEQYRSGPYMEPEKFVPLQEDELWPPVELSVLVGHAKVGSYELKVEPPEIGTPSRTNSTDQKSEDTQDQNENLETAEPWKLQQMASMRQNSSNTQKRTGEGGQSVWPKREPTPPGSPTREVLRGFSTKSASEKLVATHFKFVPDAEECSNRLMVIQYNPIKDEYLRPSAKYIYNYKGWKSCVYKASNIAHIQPDSDKAYLSMIEGSTDSDQGYIQWMIDCTETKPRLAIKFVHLVCSSSLFSKAGVVWTSSDGDKEVVLQSGENIHSKLSEFKGSQQLTISAVLSNSQRPNMDEDNEFKHPHPSKHGLEDVETFPFEIVTHFVLA